MRPIQPPRLKWRRGRPGKELGSWIIKDQERAIRTGFGEGERAKAEIALAEYTPEPGNRPLATVVPIKS